VELDPFDEQRAVPEPMTTPSLVVARHLEIVGHRVGVHDERVVPCGHEGIREPIEDAGTAVVDLRRLPCISRAAGTTPAAEGLADALVPQTHPEYGQLSAEPVEHRKADAGVFLDARARRDQNGVRPLPPDAHQVDGVVAKDHRIGSELAELLDQVVDERVVVVHDQDPDRHAAMVPPLLGGKRRLAILVPHDAQGEHRSGSGPGQGKTRRRSDHAKGTSGPGKSKIGRYTPAEESGRYTPPVPKNIRKSPRWFGVTILALLILGSC